MSLGPILIAVDGSSEEGRVAARTACAHGAGLAQVFGHAVHLYAAVRGVGAARGTVRETLEKLRRERQREHAEMVDSLARGIQDRGVQVTTEVDSGVRDPSTAIVQTAEEKKAVLIVAATAQNESGWKLGSVTRRILDTAKVPVLLVRPGDGDLQGSPSLLSKLPQSVVVPVSFEHGERPEWGAGVMDVARTLGVRLGAPVQLVHVEPQFVSWAPTDKAMLGELLEQRRTALHESLDELCQRLDESGVTARFTVLYQDGSVPKTLAEGIDVERPLLVLGHRRRHGLGRVFDRSVAAQTARQAPYPVMVVPEDVKAWMAEAD